MVSIPVGNELMVAYTDGDVKLHRIWRDSVWSSHIYCILVGTIYISHLEDISGLRLCRVCSCVDGHEWWWRWGLMVGSTLVDVFNWLEEINFRNDHQHQISQWSEHQLPCVSPALWYVTTIIKTNSLIVLGTMIRTAAKHFLFGVGGCCWGTMVGQDQNLRRSRPLYSWVIYSCLAEICEDKWCG
jgi:hypothetical protein